jgi:hypothetical protein
VEGVGVGVPTLLVVKGGSLASGQASVYGTLGRSSNDEHHCLWSGNKGRVDKRWRWHLGR